MWVKYINRMMSASEYTSLDIPGPSVVSVGDARDNRRDLYESYKTNFIGDLIFFINWIKSGAPIEVIELQDPVLYKDTDGSIKNVYVTEINPDGTFTLSQGGFKYQETVVAKNVPYESVQRVNPDNRSGVQTKPGLTNMVEKLRLDVTNIISIFSELHQDSKALRENFTMKSHKGHYGDYTKSAKGNNWLSNQAKQIFDKITDFYSAKQNLRNRDAREIITEVKKILDKFVGVLQLIIPREIHTYYDMEKKRERQAEIEERGRRVEGDTPRDHRRERSRSPTRGHGSPPRRRGGKSMKPKQHRNRQTQKKQRKNQKK